MNRQTVERPYADEVNYWKTGTSSPESLIDKAKQEIRKVGGLVHGSAMVEEELTHVAAFAIAFELHGDKYQIKWPVLRPKCPKDFPAAKRQAATALYYDVKAACVKLKFVGARVAFLTALQLSNGQTAAEVTNAELLAWLPKMLMAAPATTEK
jgi:hypothetical protein